MSSKTAAVQISNPQGHPSHAPSYSHIASVPISSTTRLIHFAGQTGTRDEKTPFATQVRNALAAVDKCFAAAGVTKKDIVMNRQYVVKLQSLSAADFQAREDVFLEWWRSTEGQSLPPPDSLIGVDSLAGKEILYEAEFTCIAKL